MEMKKEIQRPISESGISVEQNRGPRHSMLCPLDWRACTYKYMPISGPRRMDQGFLDLVAPLYPKQNGREEKPRQAEDSIRKEELHI